MKVELNIKDGYCKVTKEKGDPYFSGESRLLYHVKQHLNKIGFDFIKKRMHKDGHLVNELQQYLRERNIKAKRCLSIYNGYWAIGGADECLNNEGSVTFRVEDLAS